MTPVENVTAGNVTVILVGNVVMVVGSVLVLVPKLQVDVVVLAEEVEEYTKGNKDLLII